MRWRWVFVYLFHLHLQYWTISDRSFLSFWKNVLGVLPGAGAIVATVGCAAGGAGAASDCVFLFDTSSSSAGTSSGVDVEVAAGAMRISAAPSAPGGGIFGCIEVSAAISRSATCPRCGIGNETRTRR